VTKMLGNSSRWIENNPKIIDSIAEIGTAVGALTLLKPAKWVLQLLGLAPLAEAAATAGVLASPLLLSGDTPTNPLLNQPATGDPGFFGQGGTLERWIRHPFGGGSSTPGPIVAPHGPSAAAATMQHAHDYFRGKGLTEEQTAGVLSNISAESNFNPNASGDGGSSYGLFQHHADRLARMRKWAHTYTPSETQQLDYAWSELNGPEQPTLDKLRESKTPWKSGAIFSEFERPANAAGEAIRRGEGADQFVQNGSSTPGHVTVDVHLRGATAGTTAKVTSTGPVTAPPPRIETPMPMVN
jgi:hypothetical protein